MKVLLVDNDSDTILELRALCDLLGYDVQTVHCSQLCEYQPANFDLIVLSGGYWYDDELKHLEQYAAELNLIRDSQTPIIGVCLGMQLLQVAESGQVPLLDEAQTGSQQVTLTSEGLRELGLPLHFTVHKNHTRGVLNPLASYRILGHSPKTIEIIQHRRRPLIGVQFHPEIGDPEQNISVMQALIAAVTTGRESPAPPAQTP